MDSIKTWDSTKHNYSIKTWDSTEYKNSKKPGTVLNTRIALKPGTVLKSGTRRIINECLRPVLGSFIYFTCIFWLTL